jgi:hypothetical protein
MPDYPAASHAPLTRGRAERREMKKQKVTRSVEKNNDLSYVCSTNNFSFVSVILACRHPRPARGLATAIKIEIIAFCFLSQQKRYAGLVLSLTSSSKASSQYSARQPATTSRVGEGDGNEGREN